MGAYRDYVFDLYGTLADVLTDESGARLWRLAAVCYGAHGARYTPRELNGSYHRLCRAAQEKSPDPLFEIELRDVFAALYREKGVEPDARLVGETALFFRMTSLKKLRLYPWVERTFRLIRQNGSRIFLLSNAQACFTVPELRFLGIDGAFDGILLSSDAGVKKPSPLMIGRAIEEFGLDRESCVMVGNDRRADIAMAKAAGLSTVYIRTETSGGDDSPAADAELTDGDFGRIPELLGLV